MSFLLPAHVSIAANRRVASDAGDKQTASQYFELALKHADHFQSLYYLAEMNAHAVARPDLCPVAVSYYKMVVERGDWEHEIWWDAERAWVAGDYSKALLGYWMMAERGYEPAQNNVAYILDKRTSVHSRLDRMFSLRAFPRYRKEHDVPPRRVEVFECSAERASIARGQLDAKARADPLDPFRCSRQH